MSKNTGVPASPSGRSAEPEPCSTVSAVPVSVPNAEDDCAPMQRGEPIYVAAVLAKRWIDGGSLQTAWTLGWSTCRETALGAAVAACRKKNPAFDIGATDTIKIPRERLHKSGLFWAGFFAGIFVFVLLSIAASAIEARRAATENTGAVHESAVPKGDANA